MKNSYSKSIFNIFTLFALLASLLGSAAFPTSVRAASTITVESTADTFAIDGSCTLREAIANANGDGEFTGGDCIAGSGNDTILFDSSLGTATITLVLAHAYIYDGDGLTIDGDNRITLSGNDSVRVLYVVVAGLLTLQNIIITHGSADSGGGLRNDGTLIISNGTFSNNSSTDYGGGVFNGGTLTITNSTFSANSATSGSGAGIFNNLGGTLTITNSTFSNNSSDYGGGVRNGGTLTITNSTFSGNSAAYRGGVMNNSGTATILNSTFSGNSATVAGGGIDNYGGTLTVANSTFKNNSARDAGGVFNGGTLTVTNSTFLNNSANSGNGGGVINNSGTATILNSTFSGNSATVAGGGVATYKGGSTIPTTTIRNTILANSAAGEDCWNHTAGSAVLVGGNNIIETTSTCTSLATLTSDPDLGSLTGSPAYFPLNAGSPAIDAGDNTVCAAIPINNTSQNNVIRPQDGDANGIAVCDIGSYEAPDIFSPSVASITRANPNPTALTSVDFTVIFSESVTGVDASDFSLTTSGVSGATVSGFSGSGSAYTVTVDTGSSNGTIRLDVLDDDTILDAVLNPLGGAGAGNGEFTSGEIYTVIKSATFADVPLTYWASSYIERLYNAGITGGCATTPSLIYCPDSTVTRAQMAVFLLKSMHGPSFTPPAVGSSTGFTDVPVDYWAAAWIKQLAAEGITGGCGTGIYCPDATVTRAQMAVFLLKAKHGTSYSPPDATGVFTDVPVGYWADKWIEQLAVEGITGGCGTGTYCPDSSVTRAQMAVFLVRTFNLP